MFFKKHGPVTKGVTIPGKERHTVRFSNVIEVLVLDMLIFPGNFSGIFFIDIKIRPLCCTTIKDHFPARVSVCSRKVVGILSKRLSFPPQISGNGRRGTCAKIDEILRGRTIRPFESWDLTYSRFLSRVVIFSISKGHHPPIWLPAPALAIKSRNAGMFRSQSCL